MEGGLRHGGPVRATVERRKSLEETQGFAAFFCVAPGVYAERYIWKIEWVVYFCGRHSPDGESKKYGAIAGIVATDDYPKYGKLLMRVNKI